MNIPRGRQIVQVVPSYKVTSKEMVDELVAVAWGAVEIIEEGIILKCSD